MTCRNSTGWRRPSGLAAVLCLAVLAAACSSNGKKEAKGPACPSVGVLADAAQLAQFSGIAADPSNLVFRAEMVNAAASCKYERKRVDLSLAVQVHAQRQMAAEAVVHPSRYFVAVVDANERILAKKYFDLPIAFANGERQAVLRDTVEQIRIPVKKKKAGAVYQVLVGFELTRDQANFNRVNSEASGNSANGLEAPGNGTNSSEVSGKTAANSDAPGNGANGSEASGEDGTNGSEAPEDGTNSSEASRDGT